MHSKDQIRCAGAVQFPGKGENLRCPHRAAFTVAHYILCRFVIRLDQADDKIPAAVYQGEGRRDRFIQNQGAGIVIEHDPRPASEKGEVEDRLTGTVSCVEDRAVGVSYRIGGGVHPAAAEDTPSKLCENAAVIGDLQIGLLCGRIIDVKTKVIAFLPAPHRCGGAAPVVNEGRSSRTGGIQKVVVFIGSGFIHPPQAVLCPLDRELACEVCLLIQYRL